MVLKRINPLFKWFGSSFSSTKHYPSPLDSSRIYEPFAGSAGYSLNYNWHPVTIWETNPLVSALWSWLIHRATSQDVLDIPLNVPEGTDIRTLGLSYGQELLLKHWQRTNNVGNCWTISSWGNKSGQWAESTRSRVAEQIHAVKHWKFEEPDWSQPGTWFVDPPYQYNYRYGCKDFDYAQLVSNAGRIPVGSLLIATEAACPKTGAVPSYFDFQPSHLQVTSRRKKTNNHHSKELVYVRYT